MTRSRRVVGKFLVGSLAAVVLFAASMREEPVRITLDASSPGRVFEGIGALSAGASSRLLIDYPEPQRSDILDFLFKPGFGASLHHLKVEIGGDINSTDGTEPSHARSREEHLNPRREFFERGYEWWLMKEAKKRNPDIVLDILQWGAPAWIGDSKPGANRSIRERFYSQDNADFIVRFIKGAETYHGLRIDYCGIWNETPYDAKWIKTLRRTLDAAGLKSVKIVAADQTPDINPAWKIAEDMLADSALADAVHTIGVHYSSSTAWKHALKEAFASTAEAKQTGRPIWASEDGPWRGDWEGARSIARIFNRSYIIGKMTKTITWSLVTSYYDNLPIPGSGPMKANSPWSGYYELQPALWAIAHTTQFVQPGWRYLDRSCDVRAGASYVTLRSPSTNDWSMIIETIDAKKPLDLEVTIAGDLSDGPIHVWRTTEQASF
jgi:galactosylceramidase